MKNKKIMDKEIIENQKEIQRINQLRRGLEFSVIDVKLLDRSYKYSAVQIKFRDNKESQTSGYLDKHRACGYEKCEYYSGELGKHVQGMHTDSHYNSGSVEMEVEESYTYDHLNPLTYTNGRFYFMVIPGDFDKDVVLGHIAKFKEYVIDCLDGSIRYIQDSIKETKFELEKIEQKKIIENEYSKLFKS